MVLGFGYGWFFAPLATPGRARCSEQELLVVHRLLKDRDPLQLHMQSSPKAGGCQRVARSRRTIHFHRAPCALFVDES